MTLKEKVIKAKDKCKKAFLKKENVLGVGIGYKEIAGRTTSDLAVVVLVEKKVPSTELNWKDMIPFKVGGILTDVQEVGKIVAFKARTAKWRPAPPGVSIGHLAITAGTFGAVVMDTLDRSRCILSNNHVLANSNNAKVGDYILQPGPADGGKIPDDVIARLKRYIKIKFEGEDDSCPIACLIAGIINLFARVFHFRHRLVAINYQQVNLVDSAIAQPLEEEDLVEEILGIGKVQGITDPSVGMMVKKSGRTTGVTSGKIIATNVIVKVNYGGGRVALFEDQILTGSMSSPGDSGSLLLESKSLKAVGLLFAGSSQITVHNQIKEVLTKSMVKF